MRQLVITIPAGWLLSRVPALGVNGIWLAFPLAETAALAVSVCLLSKTEKELRI